MTYIFFFSFSTNEIKFTVIEEISWNLKLFTLISSLNWKIEKTKLNDIMKFIVRNRENANLCHQSNHSSGMNFFYFGFLNTFSLLTVGQIIVEDFKTRSNWKWFYFQRSAHITMHMIFFPIRIFLIWLKYRTPSK